MARTVMALAALALGATQSLAQAHPDFSGTWVRADSAERPSIASVGDAAFRRGDMGTGWGSPLTIRQDGRQLSVEYIHFIAYDLQPPIRLSFALDGTESRHALMIGHAETVLRSVAVWVYNSLVITTRSPSPTGVGATSEMRQTLTLSSPTALVIETTRPAPPGEPPAVVRTVYTRR